jgi:hypothetical protein
VENIVANAKTSKLILKKGLAKSTKFHHREDNGEISKIHKVKFAEKAYLKECDNLRWHITTIMDEVGELSLHYKGKKWFDKYNEIMLKLYGKDNFSMRLIEKKIQLIERGIEINFLEKFKGLKDNRLITEDLIYDDNAKDFIEKMLEFDSEDESEGGYGTFEKDKDYYALLELVKDLDNVLQKPYKYITLFARIKFLADKEILESIFKDGGLLSKDENEKGYTPPDVIYNKLNYKFSNFQTLVHLHRAIRKIIELKPSVKDMFKLIKKLNKKDLGILEPKHSYYLNTSKFRGKGKNSRRVSEEDLLERFGLTIGANGSIDFEFYDYTAMSSLIIKYIQREIDGIQDTEKNKGRRVKKIDELNENMAFWIGF